MSNVISSRQIVKLKNTASFVIDFALKYPKLPDSKKGIWLKNNIQKLGPTYVKIAQFLASRSDVINDKYIVSGLKQLQDNADYIPWTVAKQIIQSNTNINEFKSIDQKPLAAASIAQVHRAVLKNNKNVVIKIKRPNINTEIQSDLQILEIWISILSYFIGSNNNKIVDAKNMIADIQNSIIKETNFENEIKNIEIMRKNVQQFSQFVKIPFVYKQLSSPDLIVMEYVPSIKFTKVNDTSLAYTIMDVFVQQFLQYGILHGDPHEGNIALSLDRKNIVMYDLGHIVYLDAHVRALMKVMVFEIMTENVDGVIKVMDKMPDLIEIRNKENIKEYIIKYIKYIKTIDIKYLKSMGLPSSSADSVEQDIPIKFSGTIYEIVRVFGIIEGICIKLDPNFKYENVFIKYIDVLLLDIDFVSYKIDNDIGKLMNMFSL